jgi:hypothetical protein
MAKSIKVRIAPPTGDPIKGAIPDAPLYTPNQGNIKTGLDLRHRISELIASGGVLNPEDKKSIYGDLTQMVGEPIAQKLMTHAYLFNQRPDMKKLPMEAKIQSFYDIGSNDPDVQNIISKTKAMGYGVVPAFRESVSDLNKAIAGKVAMGSQQPLTDEQKKIIVRVQK